MRSRAGSGLGDKALAKPSIREDAENMAHPSRQMRNLTIVHVIGLQHDDEGEIP
jgi:hypothetical protein